MLEVQVVRVHHRVGRDKVGKVVVTVLLIELKELEARRTHSNGKAVLREGLSESGRAAGRELKLLLVAADVGEVGTHGVVPDAGSGGLLVGGDARSQRGSCKGLHGSALIADLARLVARMCGGPFRGRGTQATKQPQGTGDA